jgi:hypothetical protein
MESEEKGLVLETAPGWSDERSGTHLSQFFDVCVRSCGPMAAAAIRDIIAYEQRIIRYTCRVIDIEADMYSWKLSFRSQAHQEYFKREFSSTSPLERASEQKGERRSAS